jgi:malate dehydrogenase (oxaloacetate-decarboxylating)(NADP+)
MMVEAHDADLMIAGVASHYSETLRVILEAIGPAPGVRRVSSCYLVLRPKDAAILADCAVNVDPNPEDLAETALLAARAARALGIEPRVAMLSFSNYGSVDHPAARKVREATSIAKARAPELVLDGEIQLAAARDATLRRQYFPFSDLVQDATVLIFPDLQSGNLALHALQYMGEALPVGPILLGTRLPAQVLQYGMTVREVVHLTAVGVVQAAAASE